MTHMEFAIVSSKLYESILLGFDQTRILEAAPQSEPPNHHPTV